MSVQICTRALSADKTPVSPLLPPPALHSEKSREQTFLRKTAGGWEGGIRRWDWEERKWTGVWNLVEKAGARKRETQSVCHCNGGRFDTQVSAVPVSSGRSFHYQSAPISRPHSILASQEPSCPSALYWALIGWEEHLMLHDWLLLRGRQNVLPVCAYSGTHSNGTVNRGDVSKGALKGRKKRRRNHTEGPVEYQHQGWILHIHTVCFVKYLECVIGFFCCLGHHKTAWNCWCGELPFCMVMDVATSSASLRYVTTIAFWSSAFQRTSMGFNLHFDTLCIHLVCQGANADVYVWIK